MDAHATGLDGPSLFIHPSFCEIHHCGFAAAKSSEGKISDVTKDDSPILIWMACRPQKPITINAILASRASALGVQDDGNLTQQGSGEMIHTKPLLRKSFSETFDDYICRIIDNSDVLVGGVIW